MAADENSFLLDLLNRLISDEPTEQIVTDIPYGILDEVNNECVYWEDVDKIIGILVDIIRLFVKEESNMHQISNWRPEV